VTDPRFEVLAGVLAGSHLIGEDAVVSLLAEHAAALGASAVALYLADYDQRHLVPVPGPADGPSPALPIEGTVAGRCYRTLDIQEVGLGDSGRRVWVPLLDGTERLGVFAFDFEAGGGARIEELLVPFASLAAELVMTKRTYGDRFERARRRRPLSLAAELLWHLLPPLTFGTERVVITAGLAPAHDVGGDAFDYAVNDDVAHFAVFDAMGHGLAAGSMATIAVAAYRNARRQVLDLADTVAFIDDAVRSHVGDERYVTGVLAELDLPTGRLRWCIAGHPRPLVLRRGRVVKVLEAGAHLPFGLGTRPAVGQEALEPGDRVLLYTDGIVEARGADGEQFGVERFADLVARASSEGTPAPETVRRLMHAILDLQPGPLRDDATALIVQWPGVDAEQLLPGAEPPPG